MAVSKENTIQAFGWFKTLMDNGIQGALATIASGEDNVIETVKVNNSALPVSNKAVNIDLSPYAKTADINTKLSTITGGDENVIESIGLDGTLQPVTNKTATLNLSAYAKKTDVAGALSSINSLKLGDENVIEAISIDGNIQNITNKTAVLNLSGYAKKSDVASGIRMKGSVNSYDDLPANAETGDLYNIKTAGGTDSDGTPILAGDNVVYTDKGTWDVMAGFVDTSRFVEKVPGKQLSTNDFTNADKTKLDSLKNYTLPTASDTEKGGVKIGDGLEMQGEVLNVTLEPGNNYTLPTASATEKGGVKIGDGLEMQGDTLSVTLQGGETYDTFTGATSVAGGASGLVPAPVKGDNGKFLRGDGQWAALNLVVGGGGGGVTIGSDVAATQGALWQDFVEDPYGNKKTILKLRHDDYEYNFYYDTLRSVGSTAPALVTDLGVQYNLSMVPSTINGGLWYEVTNAQPVLMLHKGNFDYGYKYDTITYKGSNEKLFSYLPFESSPTADAFSNMTWSGKGTVVESPFGGYALTNTGSVTSNTNSNKFVTAVYTIDFWFAFDKTKLPSSTASYNFLKINGISSTGSSGMNTHLQIKNNQLLINSNIGNTIKSSNVTCDLPDGRMHIAIVKTAANNAPKVYINGKYTASMSALSEGYKYLNGVTQILFFSSFTSAFPAYIDHFRIFKNQVVWGGDFDPPSADAYL